MFKIQILFVVTGMLASPLMYCQVSGCTDPMANNYNPAATMNNATCTYNTISYSPPVKVNPIAETLIESSGLQMANNYLWSFNDGGGEPAIYRIDTITNTVLQKLTLEGASNIDWEDIGFDGQFFYIGDFGNNQNGARTDLKIYKFPFSAIPPHTNSPIATVPSSLISVITFRYADQPQPPQPVATNSTKYDCEAMLIDSGKIHLFSKNWVDLTTTHYVIDDTSAGEHIAMPVEILATNYLVTAADKFPGQNLVALLGYQNTGTAKHFMHLLSAYNGGNYFNGNKRRIDLPDVLYMGQAEGLSFRSPAYGYISNEKFVRYIGSTPFITVNQQLHAFDISSFISPLPQVYRFIGNGNWNNAANWQNNMPPPVAIVAGSEIIIDPVIGGNCVLNISYTVSNGCKLTIGDESNFIIQGKLDINNQ